MATITYTAKRGMEPTGFLKSGTDLQAIASDDSFDALTTDVSGLLIDQWLQAAGFIRNSGWFQVKSNSTSAKILTLTPPVTHLRLPGVSGNYASTPDSASVSITTDIRIDVKLSMPDWTPASQMSIVSKDDGGSNKDFRFDVGTGGNLEFAYTSDGTTTAGRVADSTVPVGFVDGSIWWVRVLYFTATGTVQFFTSPDGAVWAQLGTNVSITSGAIHNGTSVLAVGASAAGTSALKGRIYSASIIKQLDGSGAIFDASRGARGASSLVASSGETWTINTSGTPPALLQGPPLVDEGAEYFSLPGVSGNYASTPDSATVSVTGNIDLRCQAALTDWSPTTGGYLVAKDDGGGGSNRDYALLTDSGTGKLQFLYTTDGSTITGRTATSSVAVSFADGSIGWVRATYDTATGNVKFYTSLDYNPANGTGTWTQLGTTQVVTSGAIHNGTNALAVGANSIGTATSLGKIYYAEVRNGIDGPAVAVFDPGRSAAGASSLIAYTGETWTINTSGSPAAALVRTTPVTLTGYKRGFGKTYSIEFKAEQIGRQVKVRRSEQQPLDASRAPETLLFGERATLDVLTEILDEVSQVPQFREFLSSCSAGEIFTFDPYGTVASPVQPHQAQLEDADYGEQRSMTSLRQRIAFSVRLLS